MYSNPGWDGILVAVFWGIAAIVVAAFSPIAPIIAQVAINFDWSALAVILTILGGLYFAARRFTTAENKLDAIVIEQGNLSTAQAKLNDTVTEHVAEYREFHESIRIELAQRKA